MVRSALLLVTLFALPLPATAQSATDLHGIWMRGDGNARVRIASCGANICATNVWIRDSSGGEEVGDRLVMSVKPKDERTLAGTAYDAKRSLTYSMELKVEPDRLQTRGCILGELLCKTAFWSRAE